MREDGTVKVLDFGLAKAVEQAGTPGGVTDRDLSLSPTITLPVHATGVGVILGTAAYMSPEQAKGRPVDRRADIFAFGCVLYEMLSGRQAFDGEDVPDILSRVLQRDPDWTRLPPSIPPSLHQLIRLCMAKEPSRRRQSAGDVRLDLERALEEPEANAPIIRSRASLATRLIGTAAIVAFAAGLSIPAVRHLRETPPSPVHLEMVTPPTRVPLDFALSPDGRHIVFVATAPSSGGAQRLFVRSLDKSEAQPIAGTDGARSPFWSADSRSIGFFASAQLFRVDIAGGPPEALANAYATVAMGGTWSADGTILFAPNTVSPVMRIQASGGTAVPVTQLDSPRQMGHRFPSFLPGGREFLFFVHGEPNVSGIYLGSLDGGAPTRLTAADTAGTYLPPDHVMFVRQGALIARRLDRARKELVGDPVTLATSVGNDATTYQGGFSASLTGILAHRAGSGLQGRLTWFDRTGKVLGHPGNVGTNAPELSPDDRRIAFDRTVQGNRDVWIMDVMSGGLTRFTVDAAVDGFPLWSSDGSRIAFESTRNGTFDVWVEPASGTGEERLLLETPESEWPLHWSKDDRFLLYQRTNLKEMWDLWALPMTGDDRTPVAVANMPFVERMGQFSPDGRWIAYQTDESGRHEIVVQAFPGPSARRQISTGGGITPRWRADGREIYFIGPDGTIMAAPVTSAGQTFEVGTPVALFLTHIVQQPFKLQYTVSRDGRFLVNDLPAEEAAAAPITVIVNWKP